MKRISRMTLLVALSLLSSTTGLSATTSEELARHVSDLNGQATRLFGVSLSALRLLADATPEGRVDLSSGARLNNVIELKREGYVETETVGETFLRVVPQPEGIELQRALRSLQLRIAATELERNVAEMESRCAQALSVSLNAVLYLADASSDRLLLVSSLERSGDLRFVRELEAKGYVRTEFVETGAGATEKDGRTLRFVSLVEMSETQAATLIEAVKRGDAAQLTALLDGGADPDASLPNGETALGLAVLAGHVDLVKLLLARGANPNRQDIEGMTALHFAAVRDRAEIETLLIAAGGDVQVRNRWGLTPRDMGPRDWRDAVQSEFPVLLVGGIMTDFYPDWADDSILFVTEVKSGDQLFRIRLRQARFRMAFLGRQPIYAPQRDSVRPEMLTDSQRHLQAYRVSPDGRSVAIRWSEPVEHGPSVLSVLSLGAPDTPEDVYTTGDDHSCEGAACRLTWSPDGCMLYFHEGTRVRRIVLDGKRVEDVPEPERMPFLFAEIGTVVSDTGGTEFSLGKADGGVALNFNKGRDIIWMAPIAFSPDVHYVAYSVEGPSLVFEDLATGTIHDTLGVSYSPAFSRDGQLLAFYEESEGSLVVVNLKRWIARRPLPPRIRE